MYRLIARGRSLVRLAGFLPAVLFSLPATAVVLPGDLDGDGDVDAADETLLETLYGSDSGSGNYDPAADLNADGRISVGDLAIFAQLFGAGGGDPDATPPDLFVTLNDIPDDMNDLLVTPPEGFQITLHFDSAGGSVVDTGSLSITSSQDIGAVPAGSELASFFALTPTRAVWEIPAGSDLARTSHHLAVSVADVAGNAAGDAYGFAVRDFSFGAPLGNPQTVFLDFDQDRSLGQEIDFLEDLREFGLSSTADPVLEIQMRDTLVAEILARVHLYYGRNPDGTPGADPVNVVFVDVQPGGGTFSRLCVGGESPSGAQFLGAASLDLHNQVEASDECAIAPQFGVFPHAIDDLWGADAEYLAAFGPLDPGLGGTPVGEDPLDATVLDPLFDPETATQAELDRLADVADAIDAFAQTVASAIAHENGHMLGLTAPGPAPAGLWGGTAGGSLDHNVTVGGAVPSENYLMNAGAFFTFGEISGRGGAPLPSFRPLSWAYLRDRVALNANVTGLFPAPTLLSALPNPVVYAGQQNVVVTFQGDGFLDTPILELIADGDPTPNPVFSVTFVDGQTVTGVVNSFFVPPALYDVRLVNPDDQVVVLEDGLLVLP